MGRRVNFLELRCIFWHYFDPFEHLFNMSRHVESIEDENVVIVLGQCYNITLGSDLQATTTGNFDLKN
jgi:hypothetical protein